MNRDRLKLTSVTGDEIHHQAIGEGLSKIPIPTAFYRFQDCDTLLSYLETHYSSAYHIVMLDMDDPVDGGMECLMALREIADYDAIVIIAYNRIVHESTVQKIFVEGGNIFFKYPQSKTEFSGLLRKLLMINWKIYMTGANRQHFLLRL